jgi:hypothetical protein
MFLAGLVVAGVIALAVLAVYRNVDSQRASETTNAGAATAQTAPAPPQPQPHSVSVVNTALTVDPASYASYHFEVPANAKRVTLNGHFTATGGSGNDIQVFLLNEDEFVNMKNGHDAQTAYNSGKVTQATIAVPLPETPMTYHLVFDNRFSLLTPKAVQVNATLDYIQ